MLFGRFDHELGISLSQRLGQQDACSQVLVRSRSLKIQVERHHAAPILSQQFLRKRREGQRWHCSLFGIGVLEATILVNIYICVCVRVCVYLCVRTCMPVFVYACVCAHVYVWNAYKCFCEKPARLN